MKCFRVVIVGKTRAGKMICIGAITDKFQALRLKPRDQTYSFWNARSCPFELGNVHEIRATPCLDSENPHHVEDVKVLENIRTERQLSMRELTRVIEESNLIKDTSFPNEAFDFRGSTNPMYKTQNGTFYIPGDRLYEMCESTVFWRVKQNLKLSQDFRYATKNDYYSIKYVGFQPPVDLIPRGTIVRLSTSAYFDKINGSSLQLSGWFL